MTKNSQLRYNNDKKYEVFLLVLMFYVLFFVACVRCVIFLGTKQEIILHNLT